MKLSQGVEWGLHSVLLLAGLPAGAAARRAVLAEHHDLPESYLAKHLHALVRAGVLHAVSGPRGGYRLARQPADITVLDVVEAIDGTGGTFVCTEIRQRGTGAVPPQQCRRPCLINAVMTDADHAWRESLRAVTVADLVERVPASVPRLASD